MKSLVFASRATNPTANIKCYVTYVTRLPTGKEEGQFLALDLGGTNFRVILAELHAGSRSVRMKCHKHEVSGNTFLICILAVGVVVVLGVVSSMCSSGSS